MVSNVTVSDPLFQNAFYIANNFSAMLYGVELVLYYLCVQALLRSRDPSVRRRNTWFIAFSTALLVLTTVNVAVEAVFGQEMWIINSGFPGGAEAYLEAYSSVWYQTMGTVASMLLCLLADTLMIYRCVILWHNYWIISVPCLLYMSSFGLAVAELYASGVHSGSIFAGHAAQINLGYLCTTIGLNIITTCIIIGRLTYLSKHSWAVPDSAVQFYYSRATSLIVESALPYTSFGIATLVSSGMNSQISILFLSLYAMFTCISPQLIILRVATGCEWSKDSFTQTQSLAPHSFPSCSRTARFETDVGSSGDLPAVPSARTNVNLDKYVTDLDIETGGSSLRLYSSSKGS